MSKNLRMAWPGIFAVLGLVFLPGLGAAGPDNNAARISMAREAPPAYAPGEIVAITLRLGTNQPAELMALGLYESVPEGWQFMAVEGNQPPSIAPPQGQTGVLEFAWISPPPLPFDFTYLLQVPDAETGDRVISGHAEYRLLGSSQVSAPVVSQLTGPAPDKPSITLLGENPLVLKQGDLYSEPGYKALDPQDGDLTASVRVEGSVNTAQPGAYTLMYSVNNSQNQSATSVQRVVQVMNEEEAATGKTGGGGASAVPDNQRDVTSSKRAARAGTRLAALSSRTPPAPGKKPGGTSAPATDAVPQAAQHLKPPAPPMAAKKYPRDGQSLPIAAPAGDEKLPLVKTGRDEFTTPSLHAASPFPLEGAGGAGAGTSGLVNTRANATTLAGAALVALVMLGVATLLWRAAYQPGAWRKPR